jgi:cell division protein FtsL
MKILLLFSFYMTVILSASGLVYSKHLQKRYFIELQELQEQGLRLQTEWEQLLLEESAWSNQARIEQIASSKLKMHVVNHADVVMIQLKGK